MSRGRRGGGNRGKHKRKGNRYNPNAPDWTAVHYPYFTSLFAPLPAPYKPVQQK